MTRGLRAVAVVVLAIWMVPGIASFGIGVHLLLDHHDHAGVSHEGQSALEHDHHHAPVVSADQLQDVVSVRRLAADGASAATLVVAEASFISAELISGSAAELPPRLIPPPGSRLHILCMLLI